MDGDSPGADRASIADDRFSKNKIKLDGRLLKTEELQRNKLQFFSTCHKPAGLSFRFGNSFLSASISIASVAYPVRCPLPTI